MRPAHLLGPFMARLNACTDDAERPLLVNIVTACITEDEVVNVATEWAEFMRREETDKLLSFPKGPDDVRAEAVRRAFKSDAGRALVRHATDDRAHAHRLYDAVSACIRDRADDTVRVYVAYAYAALTDVTHTWNLLVTACDVNCSDAVWALVPLMDRTVPAVEDQVHWLTELADRAAKAGHRAVDATLRELLAARRQPQASSSSSSSTVVSVPASMVTGKRSRPADDATAASKGNPFPAYVGPPVPDEPQLYRRKKANDTLPADHVRLGANIAVPRALITWLRTQYRRLTAAEHDNVALWTPSRQLIDGMKAHVATFTDSQYITMLKHIWPDVPRWCRTSKTQPLYGLCVVPQ